MQIEGNQIDARSLSLSIGRSAVCGANFLNPMSNLNYLKMLTPRIGEEGLSLNDHF
jgi:hypothetical protein